MRIDAYRTECRGPLGVSCDGEEVHETGYCLNCRAGRRMLETERIKKSDGSPATRGRCAECGATVIRVG